jgi:hypothetical protein
MYYFSNLQNVGDQHTCVKPYLKRIQLNGKILCMLLLIRLISDFSRNDE